MKQYLSLSEENEKLVYEILAPKMRVQVFYPEEVERLMNAAREQERASHSDEIS